MKYEQQSIINTHFYSSLVLFIILINYRFYIEDVLVYFPYQYIYPEQYQYMVALKRSLDAQVWMNLIDLLLFNYTFIENLHYGHHTRI